MYSLRIKWIVCTVFVLAFSGNILADEQYYAKLPHCDNTEQPAIFVSTLDGKISALDAKGSLLWDLETGPGPLLVSNIHKLELTNNAQWIRIIPSLSGSLYKFNGKTVDAIPITADNLLKSSFLYSDDLVIAGGREVRTYGLDLDSGEHVYECTLTGCKNKTENPSSNADNVIVVERSTITVRAHEPRSGSERWNFSVGAHNIKIPHVSCIHLNSDIMTFNLTAVLPEGLLSARNELNEFLWTTRLNAPIVSVWKWNGKNLFSVDVFGSSSPIEDNSLSPAIYIGMHNKQLYIHESQKMLLSLQLHTHHPSNEVVESHSIATIPWKPIPAASSAVIPMEHDDSTALSVLYNTEYVNGNGYYLYTEKDLKNNVSCNNLSSHYIEDEEDEDSEEETDYIVGTLWFWRKEIFLISISTALALNLIWTRYDLPFRRPRPVLPLQEVNTFIENKERTVSESSDAPFVSRFTEDFETLRCLGKGGFGIVFEVKKKIDECSYAIKRITLPKDKKSRERVMREVRSLAKFEHKNIVRYYNSWVETPPPGWQKENDQKWLNDISCTYTEATTEPTTSKVLPTKPTHRRTNSTVIDMSAGTVSSIIEESSSTAKSDNSSTSEFIVFQRDPSFSEVQVAVDSETSGGIVFDHSKQDCEETTPEEDSSSDKITNYKEISKEVIPSSPSYLYIQMQLCQKDSLKEWLDNNSNRESSQIFNIFAQIVEAVDYVHSKNLIHRDLKPSNIFFSIDGNIKVGDFGLVTEMQDCDPNTTSMVNSSFMKNHTKNAGTTLYMSPEQMNGRKYNHKVDIFSLGVIFFELLVVFQTESERRITLSKLKEHIFPEDFIHQYSKEHKLLTVMLSKKPHERPSTNDIIQWPPINTYIKATIN